MLQKSGRQRCIDQVEDCLGVIHHFGLELLLICSLSLDDKTAFQIDKLHTWEGSESYKQQYEDDGWLRYGLGLQIERAIARV